MAFYHGKLKSSANLAEEALEAQLKVMSKELRTLNAIAGACLIIIIGIYVLTVIRWGKFGAYVVAIPSGIVLACLYGMAGSKKSEIKRIFSSNIVSGVLSETLEITNYLAMCHIDPQTLNMSALFKGWNTVSGSDLIEGNYKGIKFSFSDLHLQRVTGSGKNRKVKNLFKGQWLICEMAKSAPRLLQISERDGLDLALKKSDAETENAAFNKKFYISTPDPLTAFYVLTPNFMEQILKLDNKADARTYMSFTGNRVHIALHNGRDLFEPDSKKLYTGASIASLRKTVQWDIRYITGIMDILLRNEYLFKKEEVK